MRRRICACCGEPQGPPATWTTDSTEAVPVEPYTLFFSFAGRVVLAQERREVKNEKSSVCSPSHCSHPVRRKNENSALCCFQTYWTSSFSSNANTLLKFSSAKLSWTAALNNSKSHAHTHTRTHSFHWCCKFMCFPLSNVLVAQSNSLYRSSSQITRVTPLTWSCTNTQTWAHSP